MLTAETFVRPRNDELRGFSLVGISLVGKRCRLSPHPEERAAKRARTDTGWTLFDLARRIEINRRLYPPFQFEKREVWTLASALRDYGQETERMDPVRPEVEWEDEAIASTTDPGADDCENACRTSTMKAVLLGLLSFLLLFVTSMASVSRSNMMVGSYSPMDNLQDERLVAAAEFCVSSLAGQSYSFAAHPKAIEELTVGRASKQVVASMDYRMVTMITDAHGACLRAFAATVYNQFGTLSVTKWGEEVSCQVAQELLENKDEPSTLLMRDENLEKSRERVCT